MADTPEQNYVELRSEDVQEILGTPPHWLVRWGTAIVFVGFAMMIVAAWFIRYPDVVEAKVVITTASPPVDVVARIDGYIDTILVQDKDSVKANDLLAVFKSTSNYEDVLRLDVSVSVWQRSGLELLRLVEPPNDLLLGEIQVSYADFVQHLEDFQFGKENKNAAVNSNIGSINQQIKQLEQSITFEEKGLKRINDQLKTAEERYEKQKQLAEDGTVSQIEFENERTKLADIERQRDQYEDNILRKRNEIINLKRGITDATFGQQETASNTSSRLLGSLNALRGSIDKWKQTYLLTAPIKGVVSRSEVENKQYFQHDQLVFTIIPPQQNDLILGRIMLPAEGSGKVTLKKEVILKLDNYPYYEFGTVRGQVVSKSLVPKENQYSIVVKVDADSITHNLKTSYGKEIRFEQQMQGRAEIITEDKGLIARLADHLFAER